ncbi:class I SAM-dependent methyltransferase [Marispirochaeta sp.]|uniref:class I SAM-dependent methyltransferase n=1 Tax=Marispirochaeta sp. TaxID=2038653 RepID=UPI0029C87830|nr:class I SAM-dependent methyltransferase [Marispirochaeta sp.]
MKCRHCNKELTYSLIDLGFAPPSNAYLEKKDLSKPEKYYPLRVKVCDHCWLVQTEDYAQADELFNADYAYFSSTSSTWLEHARSYARMITGKLNLSEKSLVVEIASNDGYLLKNFVEWNIPCYGIEPTDSTAEAAKRFNIPVIKRFFGESLAQELAQDRKKADLVIGNNVYAHVPDINDFTKGLKTILKDAGVITLEFPHLLNLLKYNQFDTIYHEHFSYLSLTSVQNIFSEFGLRVFNIEKLPTHGGSLRIYGCHVSDPRSTDDSVNILLQEETEFGLHDANTYTSLQARADLIKNELLIFLLEAKKNSKSIGAYGAAAKGNTLLNFAGLKTDLIQFVCDAAESKQGKFLPGSHIPIVSPEYLGECRSDYLIILPWNIADEVVRQNRALKDAGTMFVKFIPETEFV